MKGSRSGRAVASAFAWVACALVSTAPMSADDHAAAGAADDYQRGRTLFDQERYAEAAACFSSALASAPRSLFAQWLGRAYGLEAQDASLLSRPSLAIRSRMALEQAVALDPNNVGARSDLAAYYQAAPGLLGGGLQKARSQIAEITKRDAYLGQVRSGDLLWDSDRRGEAEQVYLRAERLDAHRPEARERLGSLYLELRRYPEAFARWDSMLRDDPQQPRALYGLGATALASDGRTAEGEAALRRFIALAKPDPDGPSIARAHLLLGRLLVRHGEAGAREEYETALRSRSEVRDAQRAIAELSR